jgi:hypothetical protein
VHSYESKVCPQQVSVPRVHLEPNPVHENPWSHDGKESTVAKTLLNADGSVAAVVVVFVVGHRPMPETLTPFKCAKHALE